MRHLVIPDTLRTGPFHKCIEFSVGFTFFYAILFALSCAPEKPEHDLQGRWIVTQATRNSRPTLTLEDAFFDFQDDSTLVTNILRVEQSYKYSRDDQVIRQEGRIPITYHIEDIQRDSMILNARIGNFDFVFYTRRSTD